MRRAFTLIELIIAIGLGTMIALVAWQALRAASQTVAIASRLSVENSLMRDAYSRAHERMDTWTDLDQPDDPARQRMRGAAGGEGLPFTPFATSFPSSGSGELRRGFDSAYKAPANDPRAWWRGNAVESAIGDLRHGRYALFSCTEPNLLATTDPAIVATDYGAVTVERSWLANQYLGLLRALPYYGAVDYLPANALYGFYRPYVARAVGPGSETLDGGTNSGGIPILVGHCNTGFVNSDGGQVTVRGLWRLTMASAYAIAHVEDQPAPSAGTAIDRQRRIWNVGWAADVAVMRDFFAATAPRQALLPLAPSHWPRAEVSLMRYIKSRRFVALARIRWTSPITGESVGLAFSGYGTSLRGARQQRHATAGWARWDNAPTAVNDATLDGIAP